MKTLTFTSLPALKGQLQISEEWESVFVSYVPFFPFPKVPALEQEKEQSPFAHVESLGEPTEAKEAPVPAAVPAEEVMEPAAPEPQPDSGSLSSFRPVEKAPSPRPKINSQVALEEIRRQARASLFFFAKGVLGMKDLVPSIHGPVCQLLQSPCRRRKIVLPRSFFKSSIGSIAYPIWRAIRNPDIRILIAQNTSTNAVKKLAEIDAHITRNELFRALFPEVLPTKDQVWRTDCKTLNRQLNAPEGTFEAVGVKTQVTSRHYDEIIEDDTVAPDFDELGAENVAPTKDDIELAIGWHRLIAPLFVSMKEGINTVIGTRWFTRDLMSWIDENQKDYQKIERGILELEGKPDENGTPTWPERFPVETIREIRDFTGPYMFSCLYLNKPVVSGDQIFRPEWFYDCYYQTEPRDLMVYTTVDPGGDPEDSKGEVDFNVVLTTGKSLTTGKIYVLEITRGNWNPSELIDTIFQHVRRWKPVKLGVEAQQYQKSLLHWIREKQRASDCYFLVEPITNNRRSKNARIKGLQPLCSSGTILFRQHMQALISELLIFPLGKHDDQIDALSMQLPLWAITQGIEVEENKKLVATHPLSMEVAMEELEEEQKRRRATTNPIFARLGKPPVGNLPIGAGFRF